MHGTRTWLSAALIFLFLSGCSALLPKGETKTEGPWKSFWDAQQTFDQIVPHKTTIEDLRRLNLDPASNPNITLLNYSDILRSFIPSPSINADDLDAGVQECIAAKAACIGYEVDQRDLAYKRYGGFWSDFFNFQRKVEVTGWRFNGVVLIKNNVVVYKLTGGKPSIHEEVDNKNPLGPFQGGGVSGLIR